MGKANTRIPVLYQSVSVSGFPHTRTQTHINTKILIFKHICLFTHFTENGSETSL